MTRSISETGKSSARPTDEARPRHCSAATLAAPGRGVVAGGENPGEVVFVSVPVDRSDLGGLARRFRLLDKRLARREPTDFEAAELLRLARELDERTRSLPVRQYGPGWSYIRSIRDVAAKVEGNR